MATVNAPTLSPMSPAYRVVTLAIVVVTTMISFESMAVTTAMPMAAAELGAVESYGLVFSAMMTGSLLGIVLAGPWADRAGPLPPLYAGQGLFLAGTLGCALAPSFGLLLVGRVVTGVGSGLVIVAEFVAVGRAFPRELRPRVFTWLSAAWVLPSLVGAPLAGWLATATSWRWVFGAVVLPGLLAVALIAARSDALGHAPDVDEEATPADRASHLRLARLGTLVAASAGVVQLAVHAQPPLLSPLGVLGLLAILGVALTAPRLLPPGTVRSARGLPSVMLSRAVFNASFMGAISFVPLMLSRERGVSLPVTGGVIALASLGWSAGSWLQGRSRRRGPVERSRLVVVGAVLLATGLAVLAILTPWPAAPVWLLGGALAVSGLGMGFGSTTLSVLVLDLAPVAEHGRASASLQLADVLGTVVGVAAATALFAALHRDGEVTAYLCMWAAFAALAAVGVVTGARCAPPSPRDHVPAAEG